MYELIHLIEAHSLFTILLYGIILDTILGVLRAIKERKFNSCVGIDGAIRKVAMVFSVLLLMLVDGMVNIDFMFMVPEDVKNYLGISKLGICGIFSLLFILYEAVSIMKNMALCGLPIPAKVRGRVLNLLEDMTDELPLTEKIGNNEEGGNVEC
jgi:toxin secretion/phage lysis holin